MKKCFVVLLLALVACVKTPDPSVEEDITLTFEGYKYNELQTVKISTRGDWEVLDQENIPTWLSVSPLEGYGQAEMTIETTSLNRKGHDRKWTITISMEGYPDWNIHIINTAATMSELTDGFTDEEQIGYYRGGEGKFLFDKSTMQLGMAGDYESFFITTDDQTQILVLLMGGLPDMGDTVYVTIRQKGLSLELGSSLNCEVCKMEESKMWLYNTESNEGFVVKYE